MHDIELIEQLLYNYYNPLHIESLEKSEEELLMDIKLGDFKDRLLKAISRLLERSDFSWLHLFKKCDVDNLLDVSSDEEARSFIKDYLVPKLRKGM